MSITNPGKIHERPGNLLQNLIRFDTTNPPGNERSCIEYINSLLQDAGIETTILAKTPARPNLLARIKGTGNAPPLLLYGHVDVVTTTGQQWTYPPFEARIVDDFIWGRGALDMKSGVAIYLAALLKAQSEKMRLPGDVVFAAFADEEAGSDFGAHYLVDQHPGLFKDVRYALGEFGGFNLSMGGKRFYPIMIAEKQACWMTATFRGQGGHGSMPVRGQAMSRLAHALKLLDEKQLPVHITPAVRLMVESIAKNLGGMNGFILRKILNPALTNFILKVLGQRGSLFTPLVHNTVSPTMVKGSEKINVIPGKVTLGLDGRLIPGGNPEDMLRELRRLIGEDLEVDIVRADPGPAAPDLGLFNILGNSLKELDPSGIPMPYVLSGVTDARFLSLLGIQTYGFTPLLLPEDLKFVSTIHNADERIPVQALDFGVLAVSRVLKTFH